jgi:hypothetical protein
MMRERTMLVGFLLVTALIAGGCAGKAQVSTSPAAMNYATIDTVSLAYSDPAAFSPISDHPLRHVAFFAHPAGVMIDYIFNRSMYDLASLSPTLFGYTAEDATLRAARASGSR